MKEWLTDSEKRILFSALAREKEVCEKVDKESCREPNVDILVSIVKSLEHKFYYDRLFKEIYKQGRADAIKECVEIIKGIDTYVADMVEDIFELNEEKNG